MRMVLLSSRYLNAASFEGQQYNNRSRRRDKLTAQSTNLSSIAQIAHSSLERKTVTAASAIVRSSLCGGCPQGIQRSSSLKVKPRRSIAPSANVRYDRWHSGSCKPFNVGPDHDETRKISNREHLCARKAPRDA